MLYEFKSLQFSNKLRQCVINLQSKTGYLKCALQKMTWGRWLKKKKIGMANFLEMRNKPANQNKNKTGKLKQPENAGEMILKKLAEKCQRDVK